MDNKNQEQNKVKKVVLFHIRIVFLINFELYYNYGGLKSDMGFGMELSFGKV
jgi:hypothetical protein